MAINAYTGLMGSGKSFEVVQNVILPALVAGRRVVTNVAGLQVQEINAYLVEKFSADPAKLGTIVQVMNEQVALQTFFPVEAKEGVSTPQSVVQGGDLVVIDECWRWWATGCKVSAEHMTFFRMHRHFVHAETKVTCDMVLVVQDIGDLDRKLKVVVENTYRMTKLKMLGTSKRYRVDVYPGYKISARAAKIREMQRAYDPDIFKLYSSYSQGTGGGKEGAIDKRATVWGGPLFTIVLPLFLILSLFAGWRLWAFFHPAAKSSPSETKAAPQPSSSPIPQQAQNSIPSGDSDWRVKGHYVADRRHYVVLSRGAAVRVLTSPPGFFFDGTRASGVVDGKFVSSYTGADSSRDSGNLPGKAKE